MNSLQNRKTFHVVIIIAAISIGAGLILNFTFHNIPWSNEQDGFLLVGTSAEKGIINFLSIGYPVMLKITSRIIGSSFRAGHILSALFALLVIIQSFRINQRIFASPKVSAAASLTLLLFPAFIQSAIFCTSHMAFSLFILTFWLYATQPEEGRGRFGSYIDGSLLALVFLVKTLGLLFAVAYIGAVIIRGGLRKSNLTKLIKTIAGFIMTFAALGFCARVVFGWLGEEVAGLRVNDPFEFLRTVLFDAMQVGQFTIDGSNFVQGIAEHAGEIAFRFLANPIERIIVISYYFAVAPLAAFGVVASKTHNRMSKGHFQLIAISLLFYTLMYFYISSPYNEVLRARFFLPYAPLIFGAFYFLCFQNLEDSIAKWKPIARLLTALTITFVLVSFAVTSARVFARDAKFYDYETEGLRPQLQRGQLEEATAYFRKHIDEKAIFGTNNIAFGLVDNALESYDRFHTYGTAPDFGVATKDSIYYQNNLGKWLLNRGISYFLYDSTDQLLVIRWEEYLGEENLWEKRFSPQYFEPVKKVGVIHIYRVLPDQIVDGEPPGNNFPSHLGISQPPPQPALPLPGQAMPDLPPIPMPPQNNGDTSYPPVAANPY